MEFSKIKYHFRKEKIILIYFHLFFAALLFYQHDLHMISCYVINNMTTVSFSCNYFIYIKISTKIHVDDHNHSCHL